MDLDEEVEPFIRDLYDSLVGVCLASCIGLYLGSRPRNNIEYCRLAAKWQPDYSAVQHSNTTPFLSLTLIVYHLTKGRKLKTLHLQPHIQQQTSIYIYCLSKSTTKSPCRAIGALGMNSRSESLLAGTCGYHLFYSAFIGAMQGQDHGKSRQKLIISGYSP